MEEESKEPGIAADQGAAQQNQLKPKYEKWLAMSQRMDTKNTEAQQRSSTTKKRKTLQPCAKHLNPNNLKEYGKDELISFIMTNREKLIADEKQHKRNYVKKPKKEMNFDKQPQVKLALKFAYLGMNYKGLVVQTHIDETVENRIFDAMKKIFLIDPEGDMFKLRYTRCGRTDKGVSALGNVASLFVRRLKGDDYTQRLNRVLPADIRILGHAEVPPSFDARFSCIFREYNYFFFAEKLDVRLMAASAQKLVGLHDFRNFCKKDDSMVLRAFAGNSGGVGGNDEDSEQQNFMRRIFSFRTQLVQKNEQCPQLSIYKCVIKGTAFLWHQVRMMMSVLFMIGKAEESPDIIDKLFDIETITERPNYDFAPGENLILTDCGFEDITWTNQLYADYETYANFKNIYQDSTIEVCLKQRLMGYFFKQFVSSEQLNQQLKRQAGPQEPLRHFPWLQVCDQIPQRNKQLKSEKQITREIIRQKQQGIAEVKNGAEVKEPASKRQRTD